MNKLLVLFVRGCALAAKKRMLNFNFLESTVGDCFESCKHCR